MHLRIFFITLGVGSAMCASIILMYHSAYHSTVPVSHSNHINIERTIAELLTLGFDEHAPVINFLRSYSDIKGDAHDSLASVDVATLARITDLTKRLLISYVEDAQCCRDLGMTPDHILLTFTHDKILRLTIAYDELRHQLKALEMPSWDEIQARLERMAEIAKQSIAHAKRDIGRMARQEIAQDTPLLGLLKAQITSKIILVCDLQKEL